MKPCCFIIALLICLLLQACGFSLRQAMLPQRLQTLTLKTPDEFSPFRNTLVNHLESVGVKVVKSNEAPYELDILSENTKQVINKISANTQVRHFMLIDTVQLQLKSQQGTLVIPPTSIRAQTHYSVNTQQILGLNNLLAEAQYSLHQDIAKQILYKLSANDIREKLS